MSASKGYQAIRFDFETTRVDALCTSYAELRALIEKLQKIQPLMPLSAAAEPEPTLEDVEGEGK